MGCGGGGRVAAASAWINMINLKSKFLLYDYTSTPYLPAWR